MISTPIGAIGTKRKASNKLTNEKNWCPGKGTTVQGKKWINKRKTEKLKNKQNRKLAYLKSQMI